MSQSLAKVYLHAIFSTKNRDPVLADMWRDELFRVIGGTINNLGCRSLTVGGVADHVHLLFDLGRTISIADALGKIKSTSSLWIGQEHVKQFHWQAGYAVFSVSQSNGGGAIVHPETATTPPAPVVPRGGSRMVEAI